MSRAAWMSVTVQRRLAKVSSRARRESAASRGSSGLSGTLSSTVAPRCVSPRASAVGWLTIHWPGATETQSPPADRTWTAPALALSLSVSAPPDRIMAGEMSNRVEIFGSELRRSARVWSKNRRAINASSTFPRRSRVSCARLSRTLSPTIMAPVRTAIATTIPPIKREVDAAKVAEVAEDEAQAGHGRS